MLFCSFFLISGFCIHYPNTIPKIKPCWKTYLIRRFWRIYPTFLIAVILTSIISFYCHVKWGDRTWNPEKIFRVATISQNYPPGNGQFLSNPSLWTIPLEIEFYALYPLAFILLLRFKFVWLIVFSICVSGICTYLTIKGMQWISFTALFLWPSWLLGAWVATLHRENKISKFKTSILTLAISLFLALGLYSRLQRWDSWLQYTFWTGFYLFMFIIFLRFEQLFAKVNKNFFLKLLAWLGKISFSLYLIHFPVFRLFGYFHRDFFGEKPINFLITLIYIIPVIFLAWLFFICIENPIHKWSKQEKSFK